MKKVFSTLLVVVFLLAMAGEVYAVEINPYTAGYTEGYLVSLTSGVSGEEAAPARAEIETYAGYHYIFDIDPGAKFIIDRRPVSRDALQAGMEVYGVLQGKKLVSLEAYSTAAMGYISPGSRVRKGIIKNIDRSQIEIAQSNGQQATYYTAPATIVQRKGQNVALDSLYEGDQILLYFDDLQTDIISRMQVEGDSILVKDLYKGRLALVDELDNTIGLEDIEVFRNGQWQELTAVYSMPFSNDMPLYIGGQKIPLQNLKYYRGKTAYLVGKNIMGRDNIASMIIKNQYEATVADKIRDINWYTEALEMDNNRNYAFDEGSIIIKNGRLRDKFALSVGDDAYILSDGRAGDRIASIIYIYNEDINNSSIGEHYIYTGRIDQVLEDTVWLKKFSILNQNEWEAYDEEKQLYYDNDTRIYDMGQGKLITPGEFFAGDYAVDEDSDRAEKNKLKDWYAYVYTDGDRIACIALQKNMDALLRQRVTSGVVVNVNDNPLAGWMLSLRDSKDWSTRRNQWMPKSSNLNISLSKAMIIKEGTLIPPEELRTGDRLYLVRDDFKARVIIVK
ncbi:MAG: hypothetical protein PHO25_00665 [Syntrophomonadaceae bacterium]|nr:hypothetical protein [Syntrophomonadaceae bacterium]